MELIDEYKDGGDNTVIYWLSDKPKGHKIGLKVTVDFNCESLVLAEEDGRGKERDSVLVSFDEIRNLQTIIKERK